MNPAAQTLVNAPGDDGLRDGPAQPVDHAPASSIQERMWFAERLEPGDGLYNVPFAWRVRGTLSVPALEHALAAVVAEHEILRTSFAERDGRLVQVIGGPWAPEVDRLDLRGVPDQEQALAAWLRAASRRPFDIGTDRLIRTALLDLADGRQVFFLCAHHLVWDAASTPLFLRELQGHYAEVAAGGGLDLPAVGALDLPPAGLDLPAAAEAAVVPEPVPARFAAQVARTPGATAVVGDDQVLSYAEVDRRSRALAACLAGRGLGRGDLVGVYLERSADLVVALLGVLRSGAAYVPLDPIYPPERISGMLADAEVRLVVTEQDLAADVAAGAPATLCLDRDWDQIAASGTAVPDAPAEVTGDDLAYVIYTSGSTGRPKGVQVTHRGLGNLLASMAVRPGFAAGDTMLAVTTVCFDIAALELFLPLVTGGAVEIVPAAVTGDGTLLRQRVERSRPSHLQATPATWRMLISAGWEGDARLSVLCGGEALSRELASELLHRSGAVWNMYGPTETTIWSTVSRVEPGGPITIGHPVANTTVHVLDDAMQPVKAGQEGELWIGGHGVAAGYLRRPELTAERFRPSPFQSSGEVLYRTGDLVRELPDGRLLYVNRVDNQIKLHGYRIEPGEIESRLREHPAVAEAVVLLEGEPDGRLVAYLRCSDVPPSPGGLRAQLAGSLPGYMIPSVYRQVSEFPLTDNGKLDRKSLRGQGVRLSGDAGDAPRTPMERLLARVFAKVLRISEPGAGDSFFDLGGHSLLATALVGEIAAETGVRLTLRELVMRPVLRELAAHLDTLVDEAGSPGPAGTPQDLPEGAPAAAMQEQMWLAESLDPEGASYTVPLTWRVHGPLKPEVLRAALAEVIRRHEILRTAFVDRGGRLRQVVMAPWTPDIERSDLGALPQDGRRAAVAAIVDTEATTPFDLASGRPLRARLVGMEPEGQLLLICLHHLVFDAQSAPVFLRDLDRACARALGIPVPMADQVMQFGEVAREQAQWLAGADGQDGLAYWVDSLRGAPDTLKLGTAPPRPGPNGAVPVPLTRAFGAACDTLWAEQRVSWSMVAAAGVAAMLHRWSGSDDVTFGLPLANREDERWADVLGPCLNTVVLRSRIRPGTTFEDLLADVRDTMLDALEFQAVPLTEVLRRLDAPRRPGRTPYLDVGLNMVTTSAVEQRLGEATVTSVPFDRWQHDTKFGLTITFVDSDGDLSAVLSYRGDRHTRAQVERMAAWLAELLDHVLDNVPLQLAALPLPAAAQYRDFATAQLAERNTPAGAEGVEHWVRALEGAPAFPAVSPPLRAEPAGAVPVDLPADVLERLRPLRAEHGVSWFMVVATALAALLHRWTGQEDLTFGCPVANRDEFPDLLGPCLNTVVLRSDCAEETTLRQLLHAVRDAVLDAFDHQRVPFEAVVDRLKAPRRPGWTPYADVTLAATVADLEPVVIGGAELSPVVLDHDGAGYAGKFGLTVGFEEADGRLQGTVLYRGDRFTRGEARQLAGWLGRLVGRFADVLDQRVRTLDVLDADQVAEIRALENGGPAGEITSVPALFARQVALTPDAPAIRSDRGVLSYRALDERAAALAAVLRGHSNGTARGERPVAALLLPRGEDLVVAMLGAWQAGFVYCPLDPVYPAARVEFILNDLEAAVVVTDDPQAVVAANPDGIPVVDIAGVPPEPPWPAAPAFPEPDSAAYVLYTSGTTGQPKGVEYSHRSLAQVTRWHIEAFQVGPADRISQIHSVAFDMTEYEIWPALCSGAELLPYERSVVAPELAAWLDERRVTMFFTPTPLAEALWSAGAPLRSLRWLIFAGSALTTMPPVTDYGILDAYGPTETYITTTHIMDPAAAAVINCAGRPVPGVRLYVLNAAGRRCPAGFPGEIHVGGATVANGYWRRPDMTGERFAVTDPDGERGWVYRTGDRGRWLPDGTLEYLGRIDRQLKIRGYRIEPQEIETHLRRDPLVHQAVVRGYPGEAAPLVAYLVAVEGVRADTQAVLGRLKMQLPEFMVPNAVIWLPELPMNSRGKLDKDRLPRPDRDDLVAQTAWAAPESDVERRIAAVWSDVLGIEAVGAHDNFFDLGGNSLLLATLHARLQEEMRLVLPIRQLFEYPTVHALASALSSDGPQTPAPEEVADRASKAQRARARRARPPLRPVPDDRDRTA